MCRRIQGFFQEYLAAQRGLSPHTIASYRDAIKLGLQWIAEARGQPVAALGLEDLTADHILGFLEATETTRGNQTVTRNVRLAALRTLGRYLVAEDPTRAAQYQAIVAIPTKRCAQRPMAYLERAEVQGILAGIDRSHPAGRRDYVLLQALYNTGARVQELCDLCVRDVRLATPPLVTLTGKGRKIRHVPLWPETATLLGTHLDEQGRRDTPDAPVFTNAHGHALTRFGVRYIVRTHVAAAVPRVPSLAEKRIGPHTWRHTIAIHLLQAGIDLSVIKTWLGHVDLMTTHGYIEIDLEQKRRALAACRPSQRGKSLRSVLAKHEDVITWLQTL